MRYALRVMRCALRVMRLMPDFHSKKIESCFKELKTSASGLAREEAEKRIKKYGPNKLAEEKPLRKITILISQLKSPLIYILLIAGFITLILQDYTDAGVIFASVIINTVIGFFQENKANNALSKLKKMVEHKALVLRGGREIEIDSGNITIGDIIIIRAGNRIPADARLIESANLQVNESSLTGESIPSAKSIVPISKGASLADRENTVYAGTTAVSGSGRAVVYAIGKSMEIGKIAEMVNNTKDEKTPLQSRLAEFSRILGMALAGVSFFVFAVGVAQGRGILEMFKVGVALAVASVPEGLAVAVTVILVLGMQKILKQKALVRKLVAAETLGSTTVICTDKTGTLTEGKMNVAHIVIGEKEFELKSFGSRQDTEEAKEVSLALQAAMMCNNAVIENPDDELSSWRIIGAPTESALLLAAVQSGLNREKLLRIEPKINELPFDSGKKYMITLHKKKDGYVLYEKGAPERLLDKSSDFYHHGKKHKLTAQEREKLNKTYENLTNKGLRVIGAAVRELPEADFIKKEKNSDIDWRLIDQKLTFIGFIALKDPLRPEAKETIALCRMAGIRPIIITGDHQLTARAVALEVGMKVKTENIITGEKLDKISDSKLKELVKKIDIYARVSPHHKLRIVNALQESGEVVAMTGDGINDSPALKAADIGLAVGTGTDIAKETSDIVLLDNNFKTIVAAVRQGRVIFSNIRKVITYLISDSFSEVILITGSILMGMPLAVLPAQILWINIVNDGFPHFSLALEKGDKNIMSDKPIKKKEPIMNREMKAIIFGAGIVRDLIILGLFIWLYRLGAEIDYLRTVFFAMLGFKSLMAIFSLRSLRQPIWRLNPFGNLYLLWAVSLSFALLLLAVYLPFLQNVLSTVSLNFSVWLMILSVGIFNVAAIEVVKYYFIYSRERA
ncbi:cation-translocating P-type ATPase [Candidatus Parcubacteria bacterium]|nr:cation-translocating P-type ATPase [Candidatus Parcubacteria bacterium]